MCFIKSLRFCQCPPPMEDYTIHPIQRSPVDHFGYKAKCCGCIPLKPAVIVIGIVTLLWAVLQINGADKTTTDIIPNKKSSLFYYSKLLYMITTMILMVSCGILFIGIVMTKFHIINVFVWYGFTYNCISVLVNITAFVLKILRTENKILKHVIRAMLALSWNFLFLYFLVIVNSYKIITLWA